MRTRMYGGVRGQGLAAPIYSIPHDIGLPSRWRTRRNERRYDR